MLGLYSQQLAVEIQIKVADVLLNVNDSHDSKLADVNGRSWLPSPLLTENANYRSRLYL